MLNELTAKVKELGLSDKKAKVYISLLNLGSGTADEIAKATALNRSTTYVQLEGLMIDGLVSKFKDGKKTKFNAESPLNLERLLHAQKAQLERRAAKASSFIPDLLSLYSTTGERPVIRYFDGIEGLRSVRNELLNVRSKEYYAAASIDMMRKIFSKEELTAFSKKRAAKNISVYLMFTLKDEEGEAVGDQKLLKVDEKQFPFSADVYIYDDSVSFANTSGRVGGIIIESKAIAETLRSIFRLYWEVFSQKK